MAQGIFISLDQANAIAGLLSAAVKKGAITQAALDPYRVLIQDPVITVTPKAIQIATYVSGTTAHLVALCDDGTLFDYYPDTAGASPTWHRISSPSTTTGITFPLPGVELVQQATDGTAAAFTLRQQ
jgi:hypothetical protein